MPWAGDNLQPGLLSFVKMILDKMLEREVCLFFQVLDADTSGTGEKVFVHSGFGKSLFIVGEEHIKSMKSCKDF